MIQKSILALIVGLLCFVNAVPVPCDTETEVYVALFESIFCVNYQTGERRELYNLTGFPQPLGSAESTFVTMNDLIIYSGQTPDGMNILAVTISLYDGNIVTTGPGANIQNYVKSWNDLFYDHNTGEIYASKDFGESGMNYQTRHIFKYKTPSSQDYISVINITLPCRSCNSFTIAPLFGYNPENQTYWGAVGDLGSSFYVIEVDIASAQLMYIGETSVCGFYGLSSIEFNPADQTLYAILPNTSSTVLHNTALVKIVNSRVIETVVELEVPKNVTPGSKWDRLPYLTEINFEEQLIFLIYYQGNTTVNDCSSWWLKTLDFETGALLFSVKFFEFCDNNNMFAYPWGLGSMQTHEKKK